MNTLDKRATKILFDSFWKNGWIDPAARTTTPDDFAYAKQKGLMFDPLDISHDALVAQILSLRKQIPEEKPAAAFLSSFTANRADWRSGIASWHFAAQLTAHEYLDMSAVGTSATQIVFQRAHTPHHCALCGAERDYQAEDLNVLNFERVKWGGVRHGELMYVLLDLQLLSQCDIPELSAADIDVFRKILAEIQASAPKDQPGALRNRLTDIVALSKDQRSVLLEILAIIGVLKARRTDRPARGNGGDWMYVADWRGEDGYDAGAVSRYFGRWGFVSDEAVSAV